MTSRRRFGSWWNRLYAASLRRPSQHLFEQTENAVHLRTEVANKKTASVGSTDAIFTPAHRLIRCT